MKEADIRSPALMEQYLHLSAADAEIFFHDRSRFEEVACPGCGAVGGPEAFSKAGFRYIDCNVCGSLFVSPRPSRQALDRYYSDSPSATFWAETFFPATAEARREKIFVPRVERMLSLFAQRHITPQSVIEVGAGYGIFLEEFRKRLPGVRLAAIEPGRRLAEVCRRKGFETLELPVEDAAGWAGRADFVACFEVLEHVHSLGAFVGALARLLKPGGYLLASGLGADGFDVQVLWRRSKSVSPPHHLNFLSVDGFERLFRRLGFADVEVLTPGQLDVDIVRNAWMQDPSTLQEHRFFRLLLSRRDGEAHEDFQRFLAKHRLSSHTWILARRQAER